MAPVRTLIVDDHAGARFLIRATLADAEVVGEAAGVEAALALADELRPDVVVLDARMPGADGFAAAALLRERCPGVAVVLCSALVDDAVRARAVEAGVAAVVPKDRIVEELPAAVLRAAGRS